MTDQEIHPLRFNGIFTDLLLAKSGEKDDVKTFKGKASAGKIMPKFMYFGDAIIDLSSFKMANKTPVLFDHTASKIAGHTASVNNDGKNVIVEGVIYNDDHSPDGQRIVSQAKQGFPWKLSLGWNAKSRRFLEKGQSEKINGSMVKGPLTIFSNNVVDEVSFVPIPADKSTYAMVASKDGGEETYIKCLTGKCKNENGDKEMSEQEKEITELKAAKMVQDKEQEKTQAELTELKAKAEESEKASKKMADELTELKASHRKADVEKLTKELNLTEEDVTTLMAADDASFKLYATKFTEYKASLIKKMPDLFTEQAEDGEDSGEGEGMKATASVDLVANAEKRAKAFSPVH